MPKSPYANSYYDPQDPTGKNRKKEKKMETPSPMWLIEACVNPATASSPKWQGDFIPMATQLLLSNRPAHLIVRNSWNPVPFEHYPSKPATCLLKTESDDKYVTTDAKVWSRQEIKATCEDCDFVSGNMWFYIPSGTPRSADDLFANVIDPLLEWNRCPTGSGEAIGSAEDSLALLHWNAPEQEARLGAEGLKKLAQRLGIVIENEETMVIDCHEEDFSGHVDSPDDDMGDAPRRIPLFDWFWLGIALIFLQLIYLASKMEIVRDWFAF